MFGIAIFYNCSLYLKFTTKFVISRVFTIKTFKITYDNNKNEAVFWMEYALYTTLLK